jgi:glutathione S-transferase
VNQWLSLVNSDVHPQYHAFFGKYDFLGDAKAIASIQDNSRKNLRKLYERIDAQLDGKQWLAGERSIADPYLFVTLRWAKAQDVDLSGLDNLHAHYDRMRNDPGVRRAMETQGLA